MVITYASNIRQSNQWTWGCRSPITISEEDEEDNELKREGSGKGQQKKVQKQSARRRTCWKGKQNRRYRTWSLGNISGLQAMYWQAFADTFATFIIIGQFNTMAPILIRRVFAVFSLFSFFSFFSVFVLFLGCIYTHYCIYRKEEGGNNSWGLGCPPLHNK